jgi:hypothetical protein
MPKKGPRGDATCAGGKCQKVRPGARRRGTRARWHAGRESALRLFLDAIDATLLALAARH